MHADSANEVRLMIKLGEGEGSKFSTSLGSVSLVDDDVDFRARLLILHRRDCGDFGSWREAVSLI